MATMPKTQHFITFQEIIRSGSIRAAARSLGITQPAVTKTINDIENYFGVKLFTRSSSGIELTEAGKRFLPHSRTILKNITSTIEDMRQFLENSSAEITFGYSSLIGFTAIPEITKEFLSVYPKTKLSIHEMQLSALLPALREGRLDFAIGTVTNDMPIQNMVIEPLFNAEFALIASKNNPLAQCETLQALTHARWVLPQTDMGYYQSLFELFEHHVVNTGRVTRTDSIITIYNLVAHAGFISVLARAMTAPFKSDDFIQLPVRETLPPGNYAIVYPKNKKMSHEAEVLIELFKNYLWIKHTGLSIPEGNRKTVKQKTGNENIATTTLEITEKT